MNLECVRERFVSHSFQTGITLIITDTVISNLRIYTIIKAISISHKVLSIHLVQKFRIARVFYRKRVARVACSVILLTNSLDSFLLPHVHISPVFASQPFLSSTCNHGNIQSVTNPFITTMQGILSSDCQFGHKIHNKSVSMQENCIQLVSVKDTSVIR